MLVWALFIVPQLATFLITRFSLELNTILASAFPGLMRSIMLVLWLVVLIFPISNALEGIKIGQWEIMLSNNVKTRDMLFGSYLGKIPIYGLVVMFLAPLVITPFALVYEVSIFGQLLMYSTIVLFALVTLWLSNVIITAISAKIGDSARGNDIAKALSWAVIPIIAIPAMGLMYFMSQAAELMTTEVFMLLPSTWCADFISWIAITFNGINLPASSILGFEAILVLGPLLNIALLGIFSSVLLVGGYHSADRLFSIGAGAGSTKVARAGPENILLRGIRRTFGMNSGVIVVTSLKDFCRKLQNLSKLTYGIFLSTVAAVLLKFGPFGSLVNDALFLPILSTLMIGSMLGIFCGITFGGVGFLDSSAQLWILKSAPRGELKFIRGRITAYLLFGIPYVLLPATVTTIVMGFGIVEFLLMTGFFYTVICGTIMTGIGITAFNPSYDDTSSSAFTLNSAGTIFVTIATMFTSLILGVLTVINESSLPLAILYASVPWVIVGVPILIIGVIRLIRSENA